MGRVLNFSRLMLTTNTGGQGHLHLTNAGIELAPIQQRTPLESNEAAKLVTTINNSVSSIDNIPYPSIKQRMKELGAHPSNTKDFFHALYIAAYENKIAKMGIKYVTDTRMSLEENLDMIASKHAAIKRR